MDLILDICDSYVLDYVWDQLPPLLSDLYPVSFNNANATSTIAHCSGSTSLFRGAFARGVRPHSISFLPRARIYSDAVALSPAGPTVVSAWPRDYMPRQFISLVVLTLVGINVLYLASAGLSYFFLFNHEMMKHPRFLKNQVRREILCSVSSFPTMTLLTVPWFVAEVRGHSRLYDDASEHGWAYLLFSVPLFLFCTDLCIYFIHRLLHHRLVYKYIHKTHHKWIVPTPFASHAFNPLDGWLHSVPYHLFVFIFPMHRFLYLGLFVFVNVWTILIHDSDMITGHPLEAFINGPAHHTLHHLYFTVNYGQYLTWADRVGGSYRQPMSADDPLLDVPSTPDMAKAAFADAPGHALMFDDKSATEPILR